MRPSLFLSSATLTLLLGNTVNALTTYTVDQTTDTSINAGGFSTSATSGDLRFVLNTILNAQAQGNSDARQINFSVGSVSLGAIPPMVNLFTAEQITIGNANSSVTISGSGTYRGLYIRQGDVTLQNVVIDNAQAQGGNGGNAGGGGMGAGGALFVDTANVTLRDVSFTNNQAVGGNGTAAGAFVLAGGGGGLGGNGGNFAGGGGGYTGDAGNSGGGGGGR